MNNQQLQLMKGFKTDLKIMEDQIAKALPKHYTAEKFARIMQTAVTRTPSLLECEKSSLFSSLLLAAQLGMEPNSPLQQCFLIPYKKECQFQLGYRGMLDLIRRSGKVKNIYAEVVYENDTFEISLGLEKNIKHTPNLVSDRGAPKLVYSVCIFDDGTADFCWMTKDEIDQVKKSSQSAQFDSSPWKKHPLEMWKKSVIKRHYKTLPVSIEIAQAINTDETYKKTIQVDMTESQAGETYEEIEVEMTATDEDKQKFLDEAKEADLKHKITPKVATELRGKVSKDRLDELAEEMKNKEKKPSKKETEGEEDYTVL